MSDPTPTVGRIVHYVSYGTPGGEYPSVCRMAHITEIGAWITVATSPAESYSRSEGRPIRIAEQWFYADACALQVVNPTGLFFNACRHDEDTKTPGTWHWPERVGP
jgi:hypothetical protein